MIPDNDNSDVIRKFFSSKEGYKNLIISIIPTSITVSILKTLGVSGALLPLISIAFFTFLSSKLGLGKWSFKRIVLIVAIFILAPLILLAMLV